MTVLPGGVTIGGTLSVGSVAPAYGLLPAGTVIRIAGTGFTSATAVDLRAAAIGAVTFVSSQEIDATLAAQTEITGKQLRLSNPDGTSVDYYSSWWGDPLSTSPDDHYLNSFPMLPLQAYKDVVTRASRTDAGWIAIQNPNPDAVDVGIQLLNAGGGYVKEVDIRVPAGGAYYQDAAALGMPIMNQARVLASAPVRTLALLHYTSYLATPSPADNRVSTLVPAAPDPLSLGVSPADLSWTWQTGAAKPDVRSFTVYAESRAFGQPLPFNVTAQTSSGGSWLSATPSTATTSASAPVSVAVSVDPSSLAPGVYRGTVTLTPVGTPLLPNVQATVLPVELTVNRPLAVRTSVSWTFGAYSGQPLTSSNTYDIPAGFFSGTYSTTVHTDGGGDWLSATALGSTVSLRANLNGLVPGTYTGEVILSGGGATLVIPSIAWVNGGTQLTTSAETYRPFFSSHLGDPAPPARSFTVQATCVDSWCSPNDPTGIVPFSASVRTNSGGNWLTAVAGAGTLAVSTDPTGLAPGVYTGAVTLTSPLLTAATQIPVTFTVWSEPIAPLTANPPSVTSVAPLGRSVGAVIWVAAGGFNVGFDVRVEGGGWGTLSVDNSITPASVSYGASAGLAPGTYTANIVISIPGQSVSVPVRVTVLPPTAPSIGSVVNAASAVAGAVASGEIITIHGIGVGAQPNTQPNDVDVVFDGLPAVILYSSYTQINAVVSALSQTPLTRMEVRFSSASSAWMLPVAAAAPAIFTLDSSGQGAAAVLNQDNSVNAPANPAARGSIIQIFGTGFQTPVGVTIGGRPATVQYAGPAPGGVNGLDQVNAIVPSDAPAGSGVAVVIAARSLASPAGVTIAVQ